MLYGTPEVDICQFLVCLMALLDILLFNVFSLYYVILIVYSRIMVRKVITDIMVCNKCGLPKPKELFHTYIRKNDTYYISPCKECYNKIHLEYYRHKRYMDGKERVYSKPNRYINDLQREETFQLLRLMNWHYCKKTGIWWKAGLKDKNGVWKKKKKKLMV